MVAPTRYSANGLALGEIGERHAEPRGAAFVPEGTVDLGQVWVDLRSGRVDVVEVFNTNDAHFVTLRRNAIVRVRSPQSIAMLESALIQGQKASAIDFHVTSSTVAAQAAIALEQLGIGGSPTRMPVVLVLALHAYKFDQRIDAEVQSSPIGFVVRLLRAGLGLEEVLTSSEYEVVKSLLDGLDHASIARLRRTSPRTVANQIVAAFRRLEVTSRLDLIRCLAVKKASKSRAGMTLGSQPPAADRARGAPAPPLSSEVAQLRERVGALEAEVEALKLRIGEREQSTASSATSHPAAVEKVRE